MLKSNIIKTITELRTAKVLPNFNTAHDFIKRQERSADTENAFTSFCYQRGVS